MAEFCSGAYPSFSGFDEEGICYELQGTFGRRKLGRKVSLWASRPKELWLSRGLRTGRASEETQYENT